MEHHLASGTMWLQNASPTLDTLLCFPGLASLTDREMAILQLEKVSFPELALNVIEVSQNPTSASARSNVVFPAIVPRCRQYLTSRCRLVTGLEAMFIQNIVYPWDADYQLLGRFPDTLLRDLAGNAFEGSSCMMAVVLACVVLSLEGDAGDAPT